ncbi:MULTISPECIES: GDSL-type esterase/lipase family protein [Chryseobacterium]|uniref:Lysophospholipase L1-like esterase n=1 Tax=Chryseobacterium camelliae TaxID=1265445 RepID=A0ABU0TNH3_9FLAO|nr:MULTISPECIES: GDSL-type esterase/lipase family protein [Chryseobacterium]MDT3407553.1 lysophospholipase L1-like esterase [Pseudacidovorax intermedius]MDQ1098594.1 lysophospholipase L1-like esterase [Chryseobacterium camelliae]MDQ1102518.1 lysophospholipase L1-like esterase [Chryseobacterium sp. SORGH_AS_1048]MDR6085952.1 lysophospholipase L1-like esterase [Chryseobacterium sp. SORGH_AS_0909]MDR6130318.1 lysophospholipase L1-like esterase [Chryseobacterium sp. SORGH_AS_1175]
MKFLTITAIIFSALLSAQDFANYAKYEKQNQEIIAKKLTPNSVLMGDSITEGWFSTDPDFFKKNNFVGRGISGQVTSQMLLRFREDVIQLKPKRVIILAGTNDIAENQGPISLDKVFGNIVSMAELAKANQIKVVLCSVLPAYNFGWRKDMHPAEKVIALNKIIKNYAEKNHIPYVDYHSQMKDSRNGLDQIYTEDEIHPTAKGYEKMEAILMQKLSKI